MNELIELIQKVRQCGVTLRAEPPDLVITPAGVVPSALRARLKQHKPDILRRLELEQSMRRLEAGHISIAVFEDGSMRIIHSETDASQARSDGGTIYSPADMDHYIRLDEHGRRIYHTIKRRFAGTTEWMIKVAQE